MQAQPELAAQVVERVARESCRRLLAYLAARSHDVAAAQDALAEAFHHALLHWPRDGIPQVPEAWLLTAARRCLIDAARHQRVQDGAMPDLLALADEAYELTSHEADFPDERLKLLFVCAHPAIDAAARAPLMLQVVLGLDAVRIASAFIVKPATMGQRLSRAKAKIRDAAIPFEVPEAKALPARLGAVLDAIYAAYGSGWDDITGADARRRGLAQEAIELARLLLQLMPDEPEAAGLLALMLHTQARQRARRDGAGRYVALSEQDAALWDASLLREADALLAHAQPHGRPGRYQYEAAIQSVHARRVVTGRTDWPAVVALYQALLQCAPTIGAMLGHAAAVAAAHGAEAAWALLEVMPEASVREHQPYWALRAHLAAQRGDRAEAGRASRRAIALTADAAVRGFLAQRLNDGT
jgi:RNA polymerase sigma-70 factor (ECF subfamily)